MTEHINVRGLTAADVRQRISEGLTNRVPRETTRSYGGIVRTNLFNVFNLAVFSMAGVLLGLYVYKSDQRTLYDAIAISTIALINTVVSIIQEIRAKRALDRIVAMAQPTATVIRDGGEQELPVDQIVRDEVIVLRRGDQIPVDGEVLESNHLEVDESLLTGESTTIYKELRQNVLSGSFCVAGAGAIVAQRVGSESYAQQLTRQVRSYKRFLTPLQRHIDRLVEVLIALAALLIVLVIGAAVADYQSGRSAVSADVAIIETSRSVASVITSMIPIGLILLSTVSFALGVFRISRCGALVQKLNAVESFANVDVICMDKTGTITEGRLRLAEILPCGDQELPRVRQVLGAFAASSTEKNATIVSLREALEGDPGERHDEIPFNSREKFSALRLTVEGQQRALFFGAPESLAAHLSSEQRAVVASLSDSRRGSRLLLLAEGEGSVSLREMREQTWPLRVLALVVLADGVRRQIGEVLRSFSARQIALKIISGDAAETVRAIAQQAGWPHDAERVVTGAELDAMDEGALRVAAESASLFARVSPENKRDLIAALQKAGHYVAMVGDGVNDVLALKEAELGIAMAAGNRMSKDVSDIILLNNDFATLPRVFDEGNTILGNLQSAAKLFLTKNMYAVLVMIFVGYLGLAFPFVPRHVTIIGFFAISIPALMVAFTRRVVEVAPHFIRDVLRYTAISGGVIALVATLSYYLALVALRLDVETARTVMVTQIVLLSQLNFLLIVGGRTIWANLKRNWEFSAFAAGFAGLYLITLMVVTRVHALAPLARFLELKPLGSSVLGICVGLAALGGVAMWWLQRRALASTPQYRNIEPLS